MATTDEQKDAASQATPGWQRLVWFVALWGAGAGILWLISLVIRWAVLPD